MEKLQTEIEQNKINPASLQMFISVYLNSLTKQAIEIAKRQIVRSLITLNILNHEVKFWLNQIKLNTAQDLAIKSSIMRMLHFQSLNKIEHITKFSQIKYSH